LFLGFILQKPTCQLLLPKKDSNSIWLERHLSQQHFFKMMFTIEIVSELLGHSSMKITQDSYGKVVQKKVSLEMERLKDT
jgi:integrase